MEHPGCPVSMPSICRHWGLRAREANCRPNAWVGCAGIYEQGSINHGAA